MERGSSGRIATFHVTPPLVLFATFPYPAANTVFAFWGSTAMGWFDQRGRFLDQLAPPSVLFQREPKPISQEVGSPPGTTYTTFELWGSTASPWIYDEQSPYSKPGTGRTLGPIHVCPLSMLLYTRKSLDVVV